MSQTCDLFWGSHGCDLPAGHEGVHRCGEGDPAGPCCEFDDSTTPRRIRHQFADAPAHHEWGEWQEVEMMGFR